MPVDLFPPIKIPWWLWRRFSRHAPEQIENDITGRFERSSPWRLVSTTWNRVL